ncbi:MAG TPA: DUF748 domain-containing protein [Flavobacteriales bacterium]|nr:DUF748 domain-containing protein [Flavobacteriales bacterium]
MPPKKKKSWKRRLLVTGIVLIVLFITVLLVSSPFARYFIQKYDKYYTGREITVESAYMNPFTGYVSFGGLKIYEANSDSVFFSSEQISANFTMLKMLVGTYEIEKIQLDKPKGYIIQDSLRHLNFRDWIIRWKPKVRKVKKEPVHFNIIDIEVNDGQFYYIEKSIPVNYNIKHVNLQSSGFRWYTDTVATKFSFEAGLGKGVAKGKFTVNTSNADYSMKVKVKEYELNFIEQYLQEFINYGDFTGSFDANIDATGNFKEAQDLVASGMLSLNNFHIGKNKHEDYASFSRLKFKVTKLSPRYHLYDFDSVLLENPYVKYEKYDYLDNVEMMFGKKGQNVGAVSSSRGSHNLIIQLAKYIEELARNFLKSNYRVNRFAVTNANFSFDDYSISEHFNIHTWPLTLTCDSADKDHKRVKVHLSSAIKPYGNLKIDASINPRDSSDFEFMFSLRNMPASLFNPYLVSYTSYPLNKGTVELTGIWNVLDGNIRANNSIQIIDARLARRIKNKDNKRFPVWLAMFLVRDNHNVISYQIPVSGNLRDPKFHWKDIIDDIIWNIVVKPPTTFKREHIKKVEGKIEKSKEIYWGMNSFELARSQEKFLDKMNRYLNENPSAVIAVQPFVYKQKESEHLLLFEAKKRFYMRSHKLARISSKDSFAILNMSIKDSLFKQFLTNGCKDKLLFTVQSKAMCIWGATVQVGLQKLQEKRVRTFLSLFDPAVQKRVHFLKSKNTVPYNGFSVYEINYKGSLPEYLEKAYEKMEDLDNKSPRNAYRKFRRQNRRDKRNM